MGEAKDPLSRAEVPGKHCTCRPFAEPRLHEANFIRHSVILCPVRGAFGIFKNASVTPRAQAPIAAFAHSYNASVFIIRVRSMKMLFAPSKLARSHSTRVWMGARFCFGPLIQVESFIFFYLCSLTRIEQNRVSCALEIV